MQIHRRLEGNGQSIEIEVLGKTRIEVRKTIAITTIGGTEKITLEAKAAPLQTDQNPKVEHQTLTSKIKYY